MLNINMLRYALENGDNRTTHAGETCRAQPTRL